MENRSHALWAGFFTLAMLAAAIIAGMWLNRDKTERVPYQIVTTRAITGLNPQAAVRYKGIAVGRVDKLEFDKTVPGQILINIGIDPATPVTPSTFATLSYQGVTGIAFIELDEDATKKVKASQPAGQIPRIPLRPGLLEQLQQSSGKIVANIESVSTRLEQLLAPENQKVLLDAFGNTSKATAHWSKVADDLGPTIAALPGLLQQTKQTMLSVQTLSNNTNKLSVDLAGLSHSLQDPNGPLQHTLVTFGVLGDTLQSDTVPRLQSLTTDAGESLKSFSQAMQELKDHPQSLLVGLPAQAPGPGEPGYTNGQH